MSRRTRKKRIGGDITKHDVFKNIKSIGFEVETTDLAKLTLVNENGETILVNSSLTNSDLEYGYTDPDEYTYIIDKPDETFKITNDSAEDSDFNALIDKIYYDGNESSTGVEERSAGGGNNTRKIRRCKYGERDNGLCPRKPKTCKYGQLMDNGKCPRKPKTCKYGDRRSNGTCPSKPKSCKYGEIMDNGKCPRKGKTCKYGDRRSNGKCPRKPGNCKYGERLSNGTCPKKSEHGVEDDNQYDENEYDDEDNVFLEIPSNKYLNQTKFNLKFRETSYELTNYSSFTDVEYISTYYKPQTSENIIVSYFFKTIKTLINHLDDLITIDNAKMYVNKDNDIVPVNDLIEQAYILPNTSLIYYNTSTYKISNFDIKNDLKIVPQMTFSCNIVKCYEIMKQLLKLNTNIIKDLKETCNREDCKNEKELIHALNEKSEGYNYDEYAIETSFNIMIMLFKNKQMSKYNLEQDDKYVKMLKMYMFLIIYKLFIYLNSFISAIGTSENMLKKHLSFAIRHSNHSLFLEMKKILIKLLGNENKIKEFLSTLLNNPNLDKMIYDTNLIKNKRRSLLVSLKTNNEDSENYFGNPVKSIENYFEYLYEKNDDWLVVNNIDEKSTKFDLSENTIIIEFRDFPFYMYSYLYLNSNDSLKNDIIANNIGTLNVKIVKDYMKSKTHHFKE